MCMFIKKLHVYIYMYLYLSIFFGSQMTGLNGCVNRGCTQVKKVKHPLATVQVRLERN